MQRPGVQLPPEDVETAIDDVFALPEFRDEPSLLDEAIADLLEWLGDLFGAGPDVDTENLAKGAEVLLWILVVIAAAGLVWLLFRIGVPGLGRWRARRKVSEEDQLVIRRVEELRRAAREAEGALDWTRALRLHFFAAVVGLGERGDLDYRDAWTNRELLERGEPSDHVRNSLAPLVHELDERSFGLRSTAAEDVRRFSEVCDDLIGEDGQGEVAA